jgi:hypothetical protein
VTVIAKLENRYYLPDDNPAANKMLLDQKQFAGFGREIISSCSGVKLPAAV